MEIDIQKNLVSLMVNLEITVVIYFLVVNEAFSSFPNERIWENYPSNMSEVFSASVSEITTPSVVICAAHASLHPPANVACHKASRCVWASVDLVQAGGVQTDFFTCWASQVCLHEGELLKENDSVVASKPDWTCPQNLTCSKQGMILQEFPPLRTTCTSPFTQHSFGCIYDSKDFFGTYCEANNYCKLLGARLASPETQEDGVAMMDHYNSSYRYYVGLNKLEGTWQWPANQRDPGPSESGEWGPWEPSGDGSLAVTFYARRAAVYRLSDVDLSFEAHVLCHVWGLY